MAGGHYLRPPRRLRCSVPPVKLRTLPDSYAVVRLQPGPELPDWVDKGPFRSVTRTDHEVSVVCRDHDVPDGESVDRAERALVHPVGQLRAGLEADDRVAVGQRPEFHAVTLPRNRPNRRR